MAKAKATIEELVGMIECDELRLPDMLVLISCSIFFTSGGENPRHSATPPPHLQTRSAADHDNLPYRFALLDHQETCHWGSRADTRVGVGRHRIDVMRDDEQLMFGGVCEYFDIRALVHIDITGTDELDGWLAT